MQTNQVCAMIVNREDILTLKKLSIAKDLVSLDAIPMNFKEDFQMFFFGKTLMKQEGIVYAYPHDVKSWVKFMFNKYNA